MILGIGTDVVEISRVQKAMENLRFIQRVYSLSERAYCDSRGAQASASYAARFAGKEAILKAFGTGLRNGSLCDLEILTDSLGKPYVNVHGFWKTWLAEHGGGVLQISLSHAREYATACCIWEG